MRVQKKNKAFAYRGTIGDYNYLQCSTSAEVGGGVKQSLGQISGKPVKIVKK